MRDWCLTYFGIDLRALALFRIGVGLLLICDLINRSFALSAHYTDSGVLPRAVLIEHFLLSESFTSLHFANGSYLFQLVLFIIAGIFALGLLVGYRAKICAIVSWMLLISLQTRNPMVLQGGDVMLRVVLFWAMFLPLGSYWSIDSRGDNRSAESPIRHCSFASFALLAQVAIVYLFTALLKDGHAWIRDYTAIEMALRIDQFTTPLGHYLLGFPDFLRWLTWLSINIEWFAPILVFVPILTRPLRNVVAIGLILFHLVGIQWCMKLGLFPWICAVCWVPFVSFKRTGEKEVSDPVSVKSAVRAVPLALIFILVIGWNIRELDFKRWEKYYPESWNPLLMSIRMDQRWGMFAPAPLTYDGWYVIVGTLRDGTKVNLLERGKPVSWEKPELVSATYSSQRWRKYYMNLTDKKHVKHIPYLSRYLCDSWNTPGRERASEMLESSIYFIWEETKGDLSEAEPQRFLFRTENCLRP